MAAERKRHAGRQLVIAGDQPLIGLVEDEGDQEVTRYFSDEDAANEALQGDATAAALALAGAWSDLDWETMKTALDRIRHESQPTPPLSL